MNYDTIVTISLDSEKTAAAAAAAATEAETQRNAERPNVAREYQEMADALESAHKAFDGFTVQMMVTDALTLSNAVSAGARQPTTDFDATAARVARDSIMSDIDEARE